MLHEYRIPHSCGCVYAQPCLRCEIVPRQGTNGSKRDVIPATIKAQGSVNTAGRPGRVPIQSAVVGANAVYRNASGTVIELPVRNKSLLRAKEGFVSWVYHSQRKTATVGDRTPAILILEIQNCPADRIFKFNPFSLIGQTAGILTCYIDSRSVPGFECTLVLNNHDEFVGLEFHIREGEMDSFSESYQIQIQCLLSDVLEFNEFAVRIIRTAGILRMVHNLRDTQVLFDGANGKYSLIQRTPRAAT